jgi:hypothetical protein
MYMDKWYTLQEAEKILGISERSIRRRVAAGEYQSKKEGGRRYVYINIDNVPNIEANPLQEVIGKWPGGESIEEIIAILREGKETALIKQLQSENEYLREKLDHQEQIVLQLTRQLEQSQRLLEYKRDPWWRRWFKRG